MFTIHFVTSVTPELLSAFERLMPQLTKAPAPTADELAALIASPSRLIIARSPGETGPIVGSACLGVFRTPSGLHAHIEDVIVDSSARGQGIGQALVNTLLEMAREMGLKGVSLTCNPRRVAANELYKKMGFKEWKTNTYWYDL
ncbi:MAG: GNAT family N-acetyltransferase [Anaerolineales bacterium]|nr:GNAT family N-acetyltransferase [Anaerolineales bacterium]